MSLLMRDLGVFFFGGGGDCDSSVFDSPCLLFQVVRCCHADPRGQLSGDTALHLHHTSEPSRQDGVGGTGGYQWNAPRSTIRVVPFLSHPLSPVPEKRCFSALGLSSREPSLCHPTPHRGASLKVARERYTRHHTYINTHDTAHDARTQRHVRFEWCSSTVLTLADLPPPTDCCLFCTRSIVPNKKPAPLLVRRSPVSWTRARRIRSAWSPTSRTLFCWRRTRPIH